MSDSESEVTNIFGYPNISTTVSARGPNTNITNLSIRSQMTSTMYMPRNFERQIHPESVYDQRSMYRRETSPMSIQSACDMRPRNFQPYYRGMSSQRSVINGRSGSPMSTRSMDSTASVSAADIAFAFKNIKFNKHDLKLIKDAYHKLMKQRIRKRIEKRRNLRLFLKGSRRRSGDDSGDQGSDSSISSDDGRSIKTSYKENMSSYRPTNIDIMDFRRNVNDSNMLKDCTENVKQSTFRNMFSIGSGNGSLQNQNKLIKNPDDTLVQKDRFKNSFLLPSQRFNKSIAGLVIPENLEKPCKNFQNVSLHNVKNHPFKKRSKNNAKECETDEEIFAINDQTTNQSKRSVECDGKNLPNNKKAKLASPVKNANKKKLPQSSKSSNLGHERNGTNFEFAVPTLPIKKGKPKVQEKLIAKSAPALDLIENDTEKIPNNTETTIKEKIINEPQPDPNITDVSMRPSFIKRKLFTQNMDVAEKANISSDINSPQPPRNNVVKEKNKTRRLVTSQSCLSRDVEDDSNLLDLIHKIVPANRMNVTNHSSIVQNTKTATDNKSKKDDDKWDVTSVLSTINDEDVSDTFTDEEIFVNDKTKRNTEKIKARENPKKANMSATFTDDEEIFKAEAKNTSIARENGKVETKVDVTTKEITKPKIIKLPQDCRIVIEQIKPLLKQTTSHKDIALTPTKVIKPNGISKPKLVTGTKSFWDTDIESDMESQVPLHRTILRQTKIFGNTSMNKNTTQQEEKRDNTIQHAVNEFSSNIVPATKPINKTLVNNTVDTVQKFNLNLGNITIKSHRTVKKKKCCEEIMRNIIPKNSPKKKSPPNTFKTIPLKDQSFNAPNVSVTSSRPNTRLNTSRNQNTNLEINTTRSTSATKQEKSIQKSKLKTVEKKETPQCKKKTVTKVKSTKQKVDTRNISLKETNKSILSFLNSSRPNTRLNASKESVQLNPKGNDKTKSIKPAINSQNSKTQRSVAKEPKSNQNIQLKSTKVNKSPRNMQKSVPSANGKYNTKCSLQQKIQNYDIKSPSTRTPRRTTPRRR